MFGAKPDQVLYFLLDCNIMGALVHKSGEEKLSSVPKSFF